MGRSSFDLLLVHRLNGCGGLLYQRSSLDWFIYQS